MAQAAIKLPSQLRQALNLGSPASSLPSHGNHYLALGIEPRVS